MHDQHTGELVGATQDAFELDIIYQEMLRMYPDDESLIVPPDDDETVTNEEKNNVEAKSELPKDLVKKYLVFIFTTWDKSQKRKISFVCYRAGLKTITSEYLKRECTNIIIALSLYGFIVTTVTGDGASENRSTFENLGTHTVLDVIPQEILKDYPKIPRDFKIAMQHPTRRNILIFIMGDMPHLVKKIVDNCKITSLFCPSRER